MGCLGASGDIRLGASNVLGAHAESASKDLVEVRAPAAGTGTAETRPGAAVLAQGCPHRPPRPETTEWARCAASIVPMGTLAVSPCPTPSTGPQLSDIGLKRWR